MDSRVHTAREAAQRGAEVALDLFRTELSVEKKDGKTDIVTEADKRAQSAVVDRIRESYSGDTIVGEEGETGETIPDTGAAWVVDPIDGTNNYVRGLPAWATSVAALVDGEPVAAVTVCPALGETYVARQGSVRRGDVELSVSARTDPETMAVAPTIWWPFDRRDEYAAATEAIVHRFGDLVRPRCVQLVLAQIAAGSVDGAITNVDPNPWDTVAGAFMIRQAGGTVTDIHGDPWTHESTGLVASNGTRHDELLAVARQIGRTTQSG